MGSWVRAVVSILVEATSGRPATQATLRDSLLYAGSAVHALLVAMLPGHSIYRTWGKIALWSYIGAAVICALLLVRRVESVRLRVARITIAGATLIGAAIVPMVHQIVLRAGTDPSRHAQAHTIITEEAARALIAGENPYATDYLDGPLASWEIGVKTHFPYMPGMSILGIPRALSESPFFDARIAFSIIGLGLFGLATALWRAPLDRRILVVQVSAILPTGAVFLSGGGHELPVLALMFLSLVLLKNESYIASGLTLGAAAAVKQTAWLLIPFLVIAAYQQGRRAALVRTAFAGSLVLIPTTLPFLLWDTQAFIDDIVKFPLNVGTEETIARGPTLGRLLADIWPGGGGWLSAALLGVVAVFALVMMFRRPAASAATAAMQTGILFVPALLLSTAGRAGYGIYPINLVLWGWLLRPDSGASGPPHPVAHAETVPTQQQVRPR